LWNFQPALPLVLANLLKIKDLPKNAGFPVILGQTLQYQ